MKKKKELNELEVEKQHEKKNVGKAIKTIIVLALLITVGGVLYSVTGGAIDTGSKYKAVVTTRTWPKNEYTKGLTKPDFCDIEKEYIKNDVETVEFVKCKLDDVNNYVNNLTFEKTSLVNTKTFVKYVGNNGKYRLTIQYNGNKMILFIEKSISK